MHSLHTAKRNSTIACFLVIAAGILFVQCSNKPESSFTSDVTQGSTPWTHVPQPKPDGSFTFAIISDLNSGEREAVFGVAVEQLNLVRPEFILSIGDLIEGGTEDTTILKKEFDHFDERIGKAKAPFFHVGGNHDLTNPVMRRYWEKRYGRRYYHFLYNNVLFLMMDSEDYNETRMQEIYVARARALQLLDSGKTEVAEMSAYFKMPERVTGEISDDQSAYFEKVIATNPNVRWTFVLMHKPVWKREGDRNLSRIESALANRKYTVINGHFHEYAYTIRNNHDYIMLGTTSGGQNKGSKNAFDHFMLVSFDGQEPALANLKLEGILDKTGQIPLGGDSLCFQASKCGL